MPIGPLGTRLLKDSFFTDQKLTLNERVKQNIIDIEQSVPSSMRDRFQKLKEAAENSASVSIDSAMERARRRATNKQGKVLDGLEPFIKMKMLDTYAKTKGEVGKGCVARQKV